MSFQDISTEGPVPPIQSLARFCQQADFSPVTAWRFRKRGWLQTVNINGRQFVTSEAIENFLRRASAGEFSRPHIVPRAESRRAQ
jgi:hypothetical protein